MQLKTISEKEYQKFWDNYKYKSFLSLPYIGEYRSKHGWQTTYLGLLKDKKIIGAVMLLNRTRYFGKQEFYAPRGPLLNYEEFDKLYFFTKKLKEYIKKENGYVLRIDPYIINKQRDIDGNIVDGGIDNTPIVNNILKSGFKKVKLKNAEQDSWFFSLDLKGKDKETILKEMKPNTRNKIRKTEKSHVVIREIDYDNLEKFYDIEIKTSIRKGFTTKPLSYFQEMYKLLYDKQQVKFLLAELNLKNQIEDYYEEIKALEDKYNNLSTAAHNTGTKNNLKESIASLNKKIEECERIRKKEKTDIISLASAMFLTIKPEIIYSYSGSYDEYMNFNGQYLIQWEMIKCAIDNGFDKYNFYGIPPYINTKPKDYGIYEFKRGFNGYVEELIGEFELPITIYYHIHKIIHIIKRILRGKK